MFGLDGVGKTQILNTLADQDEIPIPSEGHNVHEVFLSQGSALIFDIAGGKEFRSIWRNYYYLGPGSPGFIFVIDSTDKWRMNDNHRSKLMVRSYLAMMESRINKRIPDCIMDLCQSQPIWIQYFIP